MEDTEIKKQIIEKREEIAEGLMDALEESKSNFTLREEAVKEMLTETKSNFSLQDIKDVIFYEEDNSDVRDKMVAMFSYKDASELDNILKLVNDAWDYFPHKSLNGLSPMEIKWLKK